MVLHSTVTVKGQVTLPLAIRKALSIKGRSKVSFTLDEKNKRVIIEPSEDFLSVAKAMKPRKVSPLKARESFEKRYVRT